MKSLLILVSLVSLLSLQGVAAVRTADGTAGISKVGSISLNGKSISPSNPNFAGFDQYFYTFQENGTVFAVDSEKMKIMYTLDFPGSEGSTLYALGKTLVVPSSGGSGGLVGFSETGEFLWDQSGFNLAAHYFKTSANGTKVYFGGIEQGGGEPGSVHQVDLQTGNISAAFPKPAGANTAYEYSGRDTVLFRNQKTSNQRPFHYEDQWTALFDFTAPDASPDKPPLWNVSGLGSYYRGEDSNYIYLQDQNFQDTVNFTIVSKKTMKPFRSYTTFNGIGGGQDLGNTRVFPRSSADGNYVTLVDGEGTARLNFLNINTGIIEKQFYLNAGYGATLSGSTLIFPRPLPRSAIESGIIPKTHVDSANKRFMFTMKDSVEIFSY